MLGRPSSTEARHRAPEGPLAQRAEQAPGARIDELQGRAWVTYPMGELMPLAPPFRRLIDVPSSKGGTRQLGVEQVLVGVLVTPDRRPTAIVAGQILVPQTRGLLKQGLFLVQPAGADREQSKLIQQITPDGPARECVDARYAADRGRTPWSVGVSYSTKDGIGVMQRVASDLYPDVNPDNTLTEIITTGDKRASHPDFTAIAPEEWRLETHAMFGNLINDGART